MSESILEAIDQIHESLIARIDALDESHTKRFDSLDKRVRNIENHKLSNIRATLDRHSQQLTALLMEKNAPPSAPLDWCDEEPKQPLS